MAEIDRIFTGKVKHDGIFDFKEMYRFCLTWLTDNGFLVQEDTYSEKVTPKGKEIEIRWNAKKKISDYFMFNLKPAWRILGMTDVEVTENGKKIKMNNGNVEIKLTGDLVKDYEHRWENKPFIKFLRDVYNRYIIKARIDQYEGRLFQECDEYIAQIKSFLAI